MTATHGLEVDAPFGTADVAEVPLKRDALDIVVAQVRFPAIMAISDSREIARFQEEVRHRYPILREDSNVGLIMGPEGLSIQPDQSRVWRFFDIDEKWQLSIAPNFLALTTTDYSKRSDFFERLKQALEALERSFNPVIFDRLGVRYVNRWKGDDLVDVPRHIRTELLSTYCLPQSDAEEGAVQLVSNAAYMVRGGMLRANWGLIPSNTTIDPGIQPVTEASWILDLDRFVEGPHAFDPQVIAADAEQFAKDTYRFFRWSVTNDFLRDRGGNV